MSLFNQTPKIKTSTKYEKKYSYTLHTPVVCLKPLSQPFIKDLVDTTRKKSVCTKLYFKLEY